MPRSPQKQYTRELYKKYSYLATWLPTVPIALGDIGIFKNGYFQRISSLKNLGLKFETRENRGNPQLIYSTEGFVSTTLKTKGQVPEDVADINADISISMSKAHSCLVHADGVTFPSIEDQVLLGDQVMQLSEQGKWDADYFVVTELLVAKSVTILISASSNARVDLSATGKIESARINLADLSIGFSVNEVRNMHTQIVSKSTVTPLFRARSVKRKLLGLGKAVFRSSETSFDELTPQDISYEK